MPAANPGTGPWRTAPAPEVPAADFANLTGLAFAGPSRGWASGFTLAPAAGAPFEPLLAAWNGRRWRTVPVHTGTVGGRLDGLAARSASDAWAVGGKQSNVATHQPLTVHWNGRRWSVVPAAGVPGNLYPALLGVAVRSASDAWAVGEEEGSMGLVRPLIEHWDGRRWRLAQVPNAGPEVALTGVAFAGTQAWAVGSSLSNSRRPVVLRWTGHSWAVAAVPLSKKGVVQLQSVTAVNPKDVWAVGYVIVAGEGRRPYALHWNGSHWAAVAVPDRGPAADDSQLMSVAAIGRGRLAAVGYESGLSGGAPLYGTWNGRAWSIRLGPLNKHYAELNAVAFDGRQAIWAVGSVEPQQVFRPMVQVNTGR